MGKRFISNIANTAGLDLEGVAPAAVDVDPALVDAVAVVAAESAGQDAGRVRCTAFQGQRIIASGELAEVAQTLKAAHDADPTSRLLVFEDSTSALVEVDLRGSIDDLFRSLRQPSVADAGDKESPGRNPQEPRPAGRPKLGVVAREVTLLPRHWEWLNRQPGGASVALRKLVEEARKAFDGRDRVRQAQEVTYRFLLALGGNLPGYEEALRALFAGDRQRFEELLASWPGDVRDHAMGLALAAFPAVV